MRTNVRSNGNVTSNLSDGSAYLLSRRLRFRTHSDRLYASCNVPWYTARNMGCHVRGNGIVSVLLSRSAHVSAEMRDRAKKIRTCSIDHCDPVIHSIPCLRSEVLYQLASHATGTVLKFTYADVRSTGFTIDASSTWQSGLDYSGLSGSGTL